MLESLWRAVIRVLYGITRVSSGLAKLKGGGNGPWRAESQSFGFWCTGAYPKTLNRNRKT